MDELLRYFIFSLIISFIYANLEINIEGKHGWAKDLPTWKITNKWTRIVYGSHPLTGYHLWMSLAVLAPLHFGFVMGIPWTLFLELKIIGVFLVAVVIEDFLWFVLNPAYGFSKFNKKHIPWHTDWFLGLPTIYYQYAAIAVLLLLIQYL